MANQMTPNCFVLLPSFLKFTCGNLYSGINLNHCHSTKAHNGILLNSLKIFWVVFLENCNVLVATLRFHSPLTYTKIRQTFLIVIICSFLRGRHQFWLFEESIHREGGGERKQTSRWNEDGDKQLERLSGNERRDCGIACQSEAATQLREREDLLIERFNEEKTREEQSGKGQKNLLGFLSALTTRVRLKRSQFV